MIINSSLAHLLPEKQKIRDNIDQEYVVSIIIRANMHLLLGNLKPQLQQQTLKMSDALFPRINITLFGGRFTEKTLSSGS